MLDTPMQPELRALLDHSKFHQGAVREVAALLPEADGAFAALTAETIAAGDQLGFLIITTAALDAGRRVNAEHLVEGLGMCGDPTRLGNFAWKMEGDVPEAILAGLKRGSIAWEMHTGALFIVAAWCVERRGGELPPEFAAEARRVARVKTLKTGAVIYLAALALIVKDEGLLAVLHQYHANAIGEGLVSQTQTFIEAALALFARPAIDLVPAEPARALVSTRPIRRAVEKLGRNEHCHCGSGRKYKHCCFEKDQERLEFSSEVKGRTHAELRDEPEAGLTDSRLATLPPFELARIDPRKVPETLRPRYIMQLTGLSLFERAAEFYESLEWDDERRDQWKFTIFFVMRAQRKDIAERMVAARARHESVGDVREGIGLLIARDDPARELEVLADIALKILTETDADELTELVYGILCSRHSALGILCCRSLIPLFPQKKASFLLEQILETRDRLNLPPDDPFSDILEKRLAEETADEGSDAAALRVARKRLDAKAAEIRQLQGEIESRRRTLDRREKELVASPQPAAPAPADEAERRDLRLKLTQLKDLLHERSAERIALRRDLEKAREDLEALRQGQTAPPPGSAEAGDDEAAHYLPEQPAGNQPLRLIEFPHKFRETLEDFPRQAARAALAMVGRLAGGEPAAFAGVVPLKACPGIFRQRIGSEHRLLFRLLPDRVQVVDLINRRDLDRKIKSLQASG